MNLKPVYVSLVDAGQVGIFDVTDIRAMTDCGADGVGINEIVERKFQQEGRIFDETESSSKHKVLYGAS